MRCFETTKTAHTLISQEQPLQHRRSHQCLFQLATIDPDARSITQRTTTLTSSWERTKNRLGNDLWIPVIRCVGRFSFWGACSKNAQGLVSSASYSGSALADRCDSSICCNENFMTLAKPIFSSRLNDCRRKLELPDAFHVRDVMHLPVAESPMIPRGTPG